MNTYTYDTRCKINSMIEDKSLSRLVHKLVHRPSPSFSLLGIRLHKGYRLSSIFDDWNHKISAQLEPHTTFSHSPQTVHLIHITTTTTAGIHGQFLHSVDTLRSQVIICDVVQSHVYYHSWKTQTVHVVYLHTFFLLFSRGSTIFVTLRHNCICLEVLCA